MPLPSKSVFDVKAQDEDWFVNEVATIVSNRSLNNIPTMLLLQQVLSDQALTTIFESSEPDIDLISICIQHAGHQMIVSFNADCIQFTPHPNYLKSPVLLKSSLAALAGVFAKQPELFQRKGKSQNSCSLTGVTCAVTAHLSLLNDLNSVALRHIDAKALDKFINRSLLDASLLDAYLRFAGGCLQRIHSLTAAAGNSSIFGSQEILDILQCADLILGHKALWLELNGNQTEYGQLIENMLENVCQVVQSLDAHRDDGVLANGTEQMLFGKPADEVELKYRRAIYVAKFVMANSPDSKECNINAIKVSTFYIFVYLYMFIKLSLVPTY